MNGIVAICREYTGNWEADSVLCGWRSRGSVGSFDSDSIGFRVFILFSSVGTVYDNVGGDELFERQRFEALTDEEIQMGCFAVS